MATEAPTYKLSPAEWSRKVTGYISEPTSVRETTTTTGTGALTLLGAVGMFVAAATLYAPGDTFGGAVTDGYDWEYGYYTRQADGTIARSLIEGSTNGGAAVNWSAGTRLFIANVPDAPAALVRLLFEYSAPGGGLVPDDIGVTVQGYDADLLALAGVSSNGLLARTGSGTAAARTITGTANQVNVANGDAVAGNPTLSLPQDIHTASTPTFGGLTLGTPLSVPNGGTGLSSVSANRVLHATAGDVIGSNAAFLFGSTPNGLTMAAGSVSNAVTHLLSRTSTDSAAGTKALLQNNATTSVGADNAGSHAAFWNSNTVTGAGNYSGAVLGSFYESLFNGAGTLASLEGVRFNVSQGAGAGVVTLQRSANSNQSVFATATTVVGYDSNITVGAVGAINSHVDFRAATTGTITAGGAINFKSGFEANNLGKTGVTRAAGMCIANQSGAASGNQCLVLGSITPQAGTYSICNISANQNIHNGNSFFGGFTSPTARVHCAAGTAAASTAPKKFNDGTRLTAKEVGADEFEGNRYITNWKSLRFPVGGPIFDHFADANNGTTVETDLYSDTLLANTFAINGDKVVSQYAGIFSGDATSTQQLRAYFGGTLILDTGALAIGVATPSWDLEITCIRESSSIVRCSAKLRTSSAALPSLTTYTKVTGLTLTNTQILKVTGTAAGASGGSNQVTASLGFVEYRPAVN